MGRKEDVMVTRANDEGGDYDDFKITGSLRFGSVRYGSYGCRFRFRWFRFGFKFRRFRFRAVPVPSRFWFR